MRILMLSGADPTPANNGAKRRILATACHFSRGHDLTLIAFHEHENNLWQMNEYPAMVSCQKYMVDLNTRQRWWTALKSCCSRRSYGQIKYWNHDYLNITKKVLQSHNFDCVWVHTLNMVPYIEQCFFQMGSLEKRSLPVIVLDQHNVDELYFRSFLFSDANIVWRLYAVCEMMKARYLQAQWYPRFDAILCVSADDLRRTTIYTDSRTRLWLAPNGVDTAVFTPTSFQPSSKPQPVLVFVGSLDVAMNQDAVRWFVRAIWPLINQRVPGVQLWIVGRDPPAEIMKFAARPGIKVTGTVENVIGYLKQASVFVAPLRAGGGTKLKVLEAMAMGLPIVSTCVGAQGLDVESGRHLYVAEDPAEFADCVVSLIVDRNKSFEMGREARRLVERKYSWAGILNEVENKLIDLVHDRRKPQYTEIGMQHRASWFDY
jgi:glycosyltransferase involved in cell wall biosynthesis